MKRLHVHVAVDDLATARSASIRRCSRPSRRVHQAGLCQVDARRSARQLRHLDARRSAWASIISASRRRTSDELSGDLRPALHQAGRHRHRARANELLLRQVGKILDRRSGRDFLGDVPDDGRKHRLRRRSRRAGSANSTREIVLRAGADGRGACRRMRLFMSVSWSNSVATPISAICSCR